jgi:NAD(P)-dependent dehydrogenase (short-subunit alcohol dehydrogenase family)
LTIINAGATATLRGNPKVAAFAIAKSSLRIFSQSLAREMGPQGVQVAHVIIDGLLDNERTRSLNPNLQDDGYIQLQPAARSILDIACQERSCWTFEIDIRPFNEKW